MNTVLPENAHSYYQTSMPNAPVIIQTFYTALTEQNSEKLLTVLAVYFSYKSPMAEFNSAEQFAQMVSTFGGFVETDSIIIEGDQVSHQCTFHMTSPAKASIDNSEIFRITDGKILSLRTYNNPNDFPSI